MEVTVNDNNVDHALRILKKKMQREGIYKDMKIHRHFEKPSEKRARKKEESQRRSRKINRKRMEKEGY
jgi:small subunit ribosomal protein S21